MAYVAARCAGQPHFRLCGTHKEVQQFGDDGGKSGYRWRESVRYRRRESVPYE